MYHVTVQRTVAKQSMPAIKELKHWATTALKNKILTAELTIRVVDSDEITQLNTRYRQKNKPTNVLSFSLDMPNNEEVPLLGDIIICASIVNQEALLQNKTAKAHWAHMVIHGTLHLLGYDHETDKDAAIMEPEEINILSSLGFPNPYQQGE